MAMNITKVKLLTRYIQRTWRFTLDNRSFYYLTNRKNKCTEVFTCDDGARQYYIINQYLPLPQTNREQGIRKFFALLMLQ